ncbi:MFS transporter [Paracoccus denitrificans]|jgi:MFS family permease|uniref:Major facilitator superfamily MFS_1 n=1 Tax=Paracoccus denitrificans (strain Pd 1222) TaxID=318586 RepID=A1AZN1_PARDP|nr:MFS transporter [Paracoccus denitrificans]ABL68725.1 major facilitator superfamily MFS_1 [Paracoccus denitrificans PD1222]MBB4625549.1 MFS family permease [Paracoccus denitrificans]MCU7427282.1 MFS transporter [Paracoccus denitrificans]QAR26780.1 MFS transporter [Paracoccus denitrificans]UFS64115.1 MFS transporter [Paracoccus denitrificans]
MLTVLRTTWPLLLGILLLMVGNGMQGTLLGIRGKIEGISTTQMSVVMSAYFGGFLLGSRVVPELIRQVGHVRVFAALGSLISSVLILYAAAPHWISWSLMRLLIGFCFSGVYITAESWLNAGTTNENRGQAMSAYMIMQMLGIISAQFLMNTADPAGYLLFVIPSVLVSVSFLPILLSTQPAPQFATLKRMSFGSLFRVSPLGCIGIFLMGGVFSALFGMASVWGSTKGLSVREISAFVAAIYAGGLLLQYPIGWLSDHGDRRFIVLGLSVLGAAVSLATVTLQPDIWGLLLAAALIGGVANPVYSLLLAYTNDFLDSSDMAAASAGLLFINGVGAMAGPLITGWLMSLLGPDGFWVYIGLLLAVLAFYAGWRRTRRPAAPVADQQSFAVIAPSATPVAVEAALETASSDDGDKPA